MIEQNAPQPGADEDGFGGDAPEPALNPEQVEAGNQDQPETPNTAPETAESHDDEDVPAALQRTTDDGPGNLQNLPAEDFAGFAEDDVEEDE